MRIRQLAVLAAATALSFGVSAAVSAAPAQADGGYWDLVAIYDDYNQCLTEGSQWVGGPVIDYACHYVGGGSTELWVLYA